MSDAARGARPARRVDRAAPRDGALDEHERGRPAVHAAARRPDRGPARAAPGAQERRGRGDADRRDHDGLRPRPARAPGRQRELRRRLRDRARARQHRSRARARRRPDRARHPRRRHALARGARERAAAARRGRAHALAARRGDLRRHVQHLEPGPARASTASRRSCCRRRPRSWPSARCATRSASRRRSTTAPSTGPRRRASWRRSPAARRAGLGARGAGRTRVSRAREAGAQRRGHARQIQRRARALALAVGGAEAGLAGRDVIGAAGLVVQRAGVAQVRDGRAGPVERQQRVADVLLAVGDREVAVQRRVGAASGFEPLQRLVLAAEAREHDAEAVVADRDVARAVARLERRARRCEAIERRLELAGLRQRDADLAVTGGRGAQVSLGRVVGRSSFELFDAAEYVGHGRGAVRRPCHLTIAEKR